MTWGTDLWDRSDIVASHTQQSIEFIEKVSKFTKERSRIEQDYAKELRKVCKSFHPKKKEESSLSVHQAFLGILKETEDIAGQHEVISEELQARVYKELQNLHNEAKLERKKFLDGEKGLLQNLKSSVNALDNSKRSYEKASKEAAEAMQNFQKADKDMNMTKLQIEKLKSTSMDKGAQCNAAMEAYREHLSKTNNLQTLHYTTHFPALNDALQKGEEERVAKYGVLLSNYSEVHAKVVPIINRCLEGMKKAAEIVDGPKDSQILIDANKTGLSPPGDILFEEYGKPVQAGPNTPINKKPKKMKTQRQNKQKNVEGDGNAFQSLNPGEKIRVCKKKVDEFTNESARLLSERQALEKMLDVYTKNNALGDPESIKGQLEENAKRVDQSNEELHKYQCYLAALQNTSEPARQPLIFAGQTAPAPANGVATPPSNVPTPPPPPGSGPDMDQDDGEFEDDIRCYVLYDFQASNDGELTVSAGEELIVLERDIEETGWTQVLKGNDEGYVPTSYIQLDE